MSVNQVKRELQLRYGSSIENVTADDNTVYVDMWADTPRHARPDDTRTQKMREYTGDDCEVVAYEDMAQLDIVRDVALETILQGQRGDDPSDILLRIKLVCNSPSRQR